MILWMFIEQPLLLCQQCCYKNIIYSCSTNSTELCLKIESDHASPHFILMIPCVVQIPLRCTAETNVRKSLQFPINKTLQCFEKIPKKVHKKMNSVRFVRAFKLGKWSRSAVLWMCQSQQENHKLYWHLQPLHPMKEDGQHHHIFLIKPRKRFKRTAYQVV